MRTIAVAAAALLLTPPGAFSEMAIRQSSGGTTIAAGVPLRIQIDSSYRLKTNTRLQGHLIEPVYVKDRMVLPVDTPVFGVIIGKTPVPGRQRAGAMLNGDFTPLATAKISFDTVELPDHSRMAIATNVVQRTSSIVHMTASKSTSIKQKASEMVRARRDEAIDQVTSPHKYDRVRQFVYSQLPYHPQEVWFNTQFDADLTSPVEIPEAVTKAAVPILESDGSVPAGLLEGRLTETLTSGATKTGTPVVAILSAPLFDKERKHILLPEGTRLTGSVVHSTPARSFARSGQLRFTFRKIELDGSDRPVHGALAAAESGAGQKLSIDSEGGAKTTSPGKAMGTLVLGVLALSSVHHDRGEDGNAVKNGAVSNGFGIITRAAVMLSGSRNVASGFAFFALSKNLYGKWIARGKDVCFPRDTRIEIDLAGR